MNGEPVGRGNTVPERIRVIVAHADPPTRRAVRDVLGDVSDFVVVADAEDGIAAARLIAAGAPTVSVVMFSDRDDSATAMAALRAGACGFLSAVLDLRT